MESTESRAASAESWDVRRRLESHGRSHTGHVRKGNEDHFVVAALQRQVHVRQSNLDDPAVFDRLGGPQAYLFAVADGVGGAAGGKEASSMAVRTIVEYLSETVGSYHRVVAGQEQAFLDPLGKAVQRAHDRLLSSFARGGQGGPATTLTIALLVWPSVFLVHVGDSRAYLLRGDELRRLTRDQTLGAFLVDQRAISEQQAEQAGLNHVLSSAIGAEDMSPAVGVVQLAVGDVLLLCTDGLTNELRDDEIASLLRGDGDVEARCNALVDAALARGGRDNVTAIVAQTLD